MYLTGNLAGLDGVLTHAAPTIKIIKRSFMPHYFSIFNVV